MTGTPAGRGKKTTALAEAQRKELSGRISRNIEEEGKKGTGSISLVESKWEMHAGPVVGCPYDKET